jgi:hypothetical protein
MRAVYADENCGTYRMRVRGIIAFDLAAIWLGRSARVETAKSLSKQVAQRRHIPQDVHLSSPNKVSRSAASVVQDQ